MTTAECREANQISATALSRHEPVQLTERRSPAASPTLPDLRHAWGDRPESSARE
jgi:hypothetical protein